MTRLHNFNAGPAVLPLSVIQEVREALPEFADSGIGIMEISHRSKEFEGIIDSAIARFVRLLEIPNNYKILFMSGGATLQFSAVALNLMGGAKLTSDKLTTNDPLGGYILTGTWSEKAEEEARKYGGTVVLASTKEEQYRSIPEKLDTTALKDKKLAYLHITSNNTIYGTQYKSEPDLQGVGLSDVPLVADCSSDLLHRKIDISKYGLVYASAQKNLGPAGVTVVIVRQDLLERSSKQLPLMLNYRTFADSNSLYNTPPVFPIYCVERVLSWLEQSGGLDKMAAINRQKAQKIYDVIDSSDFYCGHAHKDYRSLMNVTFTIKGGDAQLEKDFLKDAINAGLIGLQGHRSVGGVRASLYNALPLESAQALSEFMKDFERRNG
jgi:phosphoserine aminotransferase